MTVTYSCGHSEERKVYRKRKATYLKMCREDRVCRTCYHADQDQRVFTSIQALGLPPLTGSEKATKWAYAIRWKWLGDFISRNAEARTTAIEEVCGRRSASWWIANRYYLDDNLGEHILAVAVQPF